MTPEIRQVSAGELERFARVYSRAYMGATPDAEGIEWERAVLELDRTLAAVDGTEIVATAAIFSLPLTLPGGAVTPAAGVTRVAVASTHRRRGLLTALMRRQLQDVRDRGEAVAILFASEGAIYGRFGYGVASYEADLEVDRATSAFVAASPAPGPVSLVEPEPASDLLLDIARRVARDQPGMVQRPAGWWRSFLADRKRDRGGLGDLLVALHEGPDGPDGFAIYRLEMNYRAGRASGTTHLRFLFASTPASHASLWRHCLDIDLTSSVLARARRLDEPLKHLLAEPRSLTTSRVGDGMWLCLVDVAAALAARRYTAEGRLVLQVTGAFCDRTDGTYALEGGPAGAHCRRTAEEPDLVLPARLLAACYLGGNRFTTLARAGLVDERVDGAAVKADAMFGWPVEPWCPFHF